MNGELTSYFCANCNVIYPTLPVETEGRCPRCFRLVSCNPYMGLAQLGIDYFTFCGPGGWSSVEVLRIARSMVFMLEKQLAKQAKVYEPVIDELRFIKHMCEETQACEEGPVIRTNEDEQT